MRTLIDYLNWRATQDPENQKKEQVNEHTPLYQLLGFSELPFSLAPVIGKASQLIEEIQRSTFDLKDNAIKDLQAIADAVITQIRAELPLSPSASSKNIFNQDDADAEEIAEQEDSPASTPISFLEACEKNNQTALSLYVNNRNRSGEIIATKQGKNGLMLAIENRHLAIVTTLITLASSNPSIQELLQHSDDEGNNCLHYAVRDNNPLIVLTLLQNERVKELVKNPNQAGETPLDLALNHKGIFAQLRPHISLNEQEPLFNFLWGKLPKTGSSCEDDHFYLYEIKPHINAIQTALIGDNPVELFNSDNPTLTEFTSYVDTYVQCRKAVANLSAPNNKISPLLKCRATLKPVATLETSRKKFISSLTASGATLSSPQTDSMWTKCVKGGVSAILFCLLGAVVGAILGIVAGAFATWAMGGFGAIPGGIAGLIEGAKIGLALGLVIGAGIGFFGGAARHTTFDNSKQGWNKLGYHTDNHYWRSTTGTKSAASAAAPTPSTQALTTIKEASTQIKQTLKAAVEAAEKKKPAAKAPGKNLKLAFGS